MPDFISPEDIVVPQSNDFVATFGCDYSMDGDYYQQYSFQDDYGAKARLTFGLLDNSFGLSLWHDEIEIVKIYNEFLLEASIDKDDQSVAVKLKLGNVVQNIKLIVWPRFVVSIESMR